MYIGWLHPKWLTLKVDIGTFIDMAQAMSCPNIHIYSDNLEADIDQAAKSFLDGDVVVDRDQGTVRLSKIFKWYACDFTVGDSSTPSVLEWIKLNGSQKLANEITTAQTAGRRLRVKYSK